MEQKYKIGDRVRIKSLDWYNENKDEYGDIDCGNIVFLKSMQRFCGRIVTIIDVDEVQNIYTTVLKKDYLSIENHAAEVMQLNGEMIEGLVEEETKPKFKVGDKVRIKSEDWYKQMLSIPNKLVWQNKLTNDFVGIWCGSHIFKESMFGFLGKTITIQEVGIDFYLMEEDMCGYEFNDEMIEGLVEEETQPKFKVGDRVITNKGYIGKFEGWVSDYQVRVLFEESGCNVVIHPKDLKLAEEETKPNVIEEAKTYWDSIKDAWICPEGYVFKDENGNIINAQKIVLEKLVVPKFKKGDKIKDKNNRIWYVEQVGKKHFDISRIPNGGSGYFVPIEDQDYYELVPDIELPKTFEECVSVLMREGGNRMSLEQMNTFRKLIDARNAYWTIYGKENGLEKPWEPDYKNEYQKKYCIYNNKGDITKSVLYSANAILSFPTEEMRDAFYENFKTEIESCKEFL